VVHEGCRFAQRPYDRALHVQVPAATPDGNYYATFYSQKSVTQDKLVSNVKNLSYDIKTAADDRGGAPRISVEFLNGDVAYLASQTCRHTLTNDNRWSRADFTGWKKAWLPDDPATLDVNEQTGCQFSVSGDTGGTYESDGTMSAWADYAAANPDQRVSQAYVVMDAPGNYWIDRISLGTKWEYVAADNIGVDCQGDETRC
jgi:hypothetical protein